MTRPQTRTYGVAISSSRQPLLEAMLRAFAWLVSNVLSICRTIFNRNTRDWHTDEVKEDHVQTSGGITQEAQHPQPSFSGKRKARILGIPVASTQGTTPYSLCAPYRDAWDKPKHDSLHDHDSLPVIPAEARKREEREPRSHAHGLSSRKPRSGYPGPIRPQSESAKWFPARATLSRDDKHSLT